MNRATTTLLFCAAIAACAMLALADPPARNSDQRAKTTGVTWYVDDDAPNDPGPGNPAISDPAENGSANYPFDAIQEAINASSDGDTAILLDGTYTGTGNRDIDFLGKAITVISQNGPSGCIINPQGTEAAPHRGFHFHQSEGQTSILDGVTITGGHAPLGWPAFPALYAGGAIYCAQSSPTIRNCVITQNTAARSYMPPPNPSRRAEGGGIACFGSSALITDCLITQNVVSNYVSASAEGSGGGGIVCTGGGAPTIRNCRITKNRYVSTSTGTTIVIGYGAGVSLENCHAKVQNCEIIGNRMDGLMNIGFGGGIVAFFSPGIEVSDTAIVGNSASGGAGAAFYGRMFVRNCLFEGNQSNAGGGGLFQHDSGSQIANCVITGNSSSSRGGGLQLLDSGSIVNCLIAGNTATEGGGVYCATTNGQGMSLLTITDNTASSNGGGILVDPTVTGNAILDSLVWGNSPNGLAGDIGPDYCDIQSFPSAPPHIISADPLFGPNTSGTWTANGAYDASSCHVVLTDASASWTPGRWVGALVNPDLTQARRFKIIENTSTTLTIWADYQAIEASASWVQMGKSYQIRHYSLSATSPCVDAGSNLLVPADLADLDGDADTTELVPIELAGGARFIDIPPAGGTGVPAPPQYPDIVDMGAFEASQTGPPVVQAFSVFRPGDGGDGLDGWIAFIGLQIDWASDEGTPRGCLRSLDNDAYSGGRVQAPAKFLGNWTGLQVAGILRFDLRYFDLDGFEIVANPHVRLVGPGGEAYHQFDTPVEQSWRTYQVALSESQWTVTQGTWAGLLADVESLTASMDFTYGQDQHGLDNVFLGIPEDCNTNGVPDVLDVVNSVSADCNTNGVPDECETGLGPVIVSPPENESVCRGMDATFTVTASGSPPINYQWQKGGIDIQGATASTFVIHAADFVDSGVYAVKVTDACGARLSPPATLVVFAHGTGDVDGNGLLNGLDIDDWTNVVVSWTASSVPSPAMCAADMDADGDVDTNDVPPFVAALLTSL